MDRSKPKRISKQERVRRLADPSTYAAMDAAMAAGRVRFGPQIDAVMRDITALIAGRRANELAGADAVKFMVLRAEFDALAIAQKHFAEADLASRLDPNGDTPAPVVPRSPKTLTRA